MSALVDRVRSPRPTLGGSGKAFNLDQRSGITARTARPLKPCDSMQSTPNFNRNVSWNNHWKIIRHDLGPSTMRASIPNEREANFTDRIDRFDETTWPGINARRVYLIDKYIDFKLDPAERLELDELERIAEDYANQHTPHPTEMIERLEAAAVRDGLLKPSDQL